MNRIPLKALAAATALAFSGLATAGNIVQVDFTGSGSAGSAVLANNLDWSQANLLFQGLLPTSTTATDFNILGHGTGVFKTGNTSLTPATVEITYIFGVPATAARSTLANTDTIAYISTLGGGYFKAYIDVSPLTLADTLAGTGFGSDDPGNILLFEGTFNAQPDVSVLTNSRTCDVINGGHPANTCALLDQFDGGIGPIDSLGGVRTTVVGGSTAFTINVTSQNTNYILNNITTFSVTSDDQTFNTSTLTPFKEVDPSKLFRNVTDSGTVAPIYGTETGPALTVNGICNTALQTICDIHMQGDASSSFEADSPLPEPGSLALVGLGLGALGFSIRRRRKVA